MDRQIRWSILASNQLEHSLKFWIDNKGNNKYSKFLFAETLRATRLASKFPLIGRQTNQATVRRILIDNTYAIYYSFADDSIDIKLWRSVKMNPKENEYEN